MEITLEKIELVKDRTGVSYREAKDALEHTDGNVVDAIIYIEETIDKGGQVSDSRVASIVDAIKSAIKKGNVSKIVIKKDSEVLINLPVNIGIIGTVLFPWATVATTIAALGTKCTVELIDDNGAVVDISSKANEAMDIAKSKGGVIVDEVKDKGNEFIDFAKDKSSDVWDAAKDKGKDVLAAAKDKSKDAFEAAKEKALRAINKNDIDDENSDFDLSDLDLTDMEEDDD